MLLQLDEWVLCRLYNKKNNWDKVKMEEFQEQGAAAHQHPKEELMDALADSVSDSFQTHDSEIENASGMQNSLGDMVQGQATLPNGSMVTVKEDNDWFTDMNLDELQASYTNMGQMVNPNLGQTVNPAAGQEYHAGYMQSISAPQMRMWQIILPPF
jgi:hypothetical protein